MAGTLIDHFNAFNRFVDNANLIGNPISANIIAIYTRILHKFNKEFYPAELAISDSTLMTESGVKSKSTVHDARNLLKTWGFIDFRKGRNKITVYKILDKYASEHLSNTCRTPVEHLSNTADGNLPLLSVVKKDYKQEIRDSARVREQKKKEIKSNGYSQKPDKSGNKSGTGADGIRNDVYPDTNIATVPDVEKYVTELLHQRRAE